MNADAARPGESLTAVERYREVRALTLELTRGLSDEDQNLQSMPDASPVKWHLAHTTWFFETFILGERSDGYTPFDPRYRQLFNSYYNAVGEQFPRPRRGLLSRPSLSRVHDYRRHVDEAMARLLDTDPGAACGLLDLGLSHEQQHQELIVTDLKHALSENPLGPAVTQLAPASGEVPPFDFVTLTEGTYEVGHGAEGFCFDNETPRHRVFQAPARVATRPVSWGEFLAFVDDGGYRRPELWLSDGWAFVGEHGLTLPLYLRERDGLRVSYTLGGERPIDPAEPVCHLSYYEADAYARWAGARLPTEVEWELAARQTASAGADFLDPARLHPRPLSARPGFLGGVWQWTSSPYVAYPGFRPGEGVVGEYNGKFMSGQMVLRGGSCASPTGHLRVTYRNFFPPSARWQFSGLRLAQDA